MNHTYQSDHHTFHYANDDMQAKWTLALLAVAAIVWSMLAVLAVRAG